MLSSLIFVGLAAAWLIVLVPMFARRRQEVARTTDAALAARVVRRGSERTAPGGSTGNRGKEALVMPETDRAGHEWAERDGDVDDGYVDDETVDEQDHEGDGQSRRVYSDDARAGRRYRPGRGGFDPEAAALAARTKYARRQRIVLAMLVAAVATGVLAAMVWPLLWWGHAFVDLVLVGYLTYLRRQVRIEEDVRARRLARMSGARHDDEADAYRDEADDYADDDYADEADDEPDDDHEGDDHEGDEREDEPRPRGLSELRDRDRIERARVPSGAVVLDLDDEDPEFDELDERTWSPYRRASGE